MTVARAKCGQAEVTWFDQSTATLNSASLRAELLLGAKPLPTRLSWEEILKSDYSVANTVAGTSDSDNPCDYTLEKRRKLPQRRKSPLPCCTTTAFRSCVLGTPELLR